MSANDISGAIHYSSEVRVGNNWEGKSVVEIKAISGNHGTVIVVDRPTAARLINQLRRALDDDYNRAINDRPGGSDDYGN